MKIIKLLCYRVVSYVRINKLIFALFSIGSIICAVTFTYFYASVISPLLLQNRMEDYYRQYTVVFSEPSSVTPEQIAKIGEYGMDNILFRKMLPQEELLVDTIPYIPPAEHMGSVYLSIESYYNSSKEQSQTQGRTLFSNDEISGEKPAAILSMFLPLQTSTPPQTVTIYGEDFRVIGTGSQDGFLIPYACFSQMEFTSDNIQITLVNNLSPKQNKSLLSLLSELFPNAEVRDPSGYLQNDARDAVLSILMVSAVYIISLLSFLYLMKYMMEQNSRENIIYATVGASRGQVMRILIGENALLSAVFIAVGLALYALLEEPLFRHIQLYGNVRLGLGDYTLIFLLMMALSLLVTLPFVLQYVRHSLITSKNKYG